jgi:hypothetical protein
LRAPDDRIVDHHHPLVFEGRAHRRELELHSEVSNRLLRLDEGPPDVMAANQADVIGQATSLRGLLFGQLHSQLFASLEDRQPEQPGVAAGEVDVVEDAPARALQLRRQTPLQSAWEGAASSPS